MTTKELKDILTDVPDDWTIVVEQPEGDRDHSAGARWDEGKGELLVEL